MRQIHQLVSLSLPYDVCFSAAETIFRLQVSLCMVKLFLIIFVIFVYITKLILNRLEANYSRYVHVNL